MVSGPLVTFCFDKKKIENKLLLLLHIYIYTYIYIYIYIYTSMHRGDCNVASRLAPTLESSSTKAPVAPAAPSGANDGVVVSTARTAPSGANE